MEIDGCQRLMIEMLRLLSQGKKGLLTPNEQFAVQEDIIGFNSLDCYLVRTENVSRYVGRIANPTNLSGRDSVPSYIFSIWLVGFAIWIILAITTFKEIVILVREQRRRFAHKES